MDKATRYNEGKLKWSLVHFASLEIMVRVLMFGAEKYAPDNWKKGMNKREILDSLQRHLASLMDGEECDTESKLHHIGHIMCNAMFYSYYLLFPEKEVLSGMKEAKQKYNPEYNLDVWKFPVTPKEAIEKETETKTETEFIGMDNGVTVTEVSSRSYDISSRFVINMKLSNEVEDALIHFIISVLGAINLSTVKSENTPEVLLKNVKSKHNSESEITYNLSEFFRHGIIKFKNVDYLMAVSQKEYAWIKKLSLSKEENFYDKENKEDD